MSSYIALGVAFELWLLCRAIYITARPFVRIL